MKTALFDDLIFGPIKSRRFGNSLGINVLPLGSKFCNFDCIYCECGWTDNKQTRNELPTPRNISESLIRKIEILMDSGIDLDAITFAGNGEPTIHPKFGEIVNAVLKIRDDQLPEVEVVVLTNATMLHKSSVINALKKVNQCMFKLDAGTEETFQAINQPVGKITLDQVTKRISSFTSDITIQSMFFRGEINGHPIDNASDKELTAWKQRLLEINPKTVVIYSLDRATPASGLEKIPHSELCEIGKFLNDTKFQIKIV